MDFSSTWDFESFADYLCRKGVRKDLVKATISNRVSSELFLSLMEEDLREPAPVIGDRVCLRNILEEVRKVS